MIKETYGFVRKWYFNIVEGIQYAINPERRAEWDAAFEEANDILDDVQHKLRMLRWEMGLNPDIGEKKKSTIDDHV